MIWAIVHEESYQKFKRKYGAVLKIAGCPGDEVFETEADARAFIQVIRPNGPLTTHPIRADWQRDTKPTDTPGVHRLIVDAEIIR